MTGLQPWLEEARTHTDQKRQANRELQAIALLEYAADAIETARETLYPGDTNANELKSLMTLAEGTRDVIENLAQ